MPERENEPNLQNRSKETINLPLINPSGQFPSRTRCRWNLNQCPASAWRRQRSYLGEEPLWFPTISRVGKTGSAEFEQAMSGVSA